MNFFEKWYDLTCKTSADIYVEISNEVNNNIKSEEIKISLKDFFALNLGIEQRIGANDYVMGIENDIFNLLKVTIESNIKFEIKAYMLGHIYRVIENVSQHRDLQIQPKYQEIISKY